jgi:23S rRNA pseudouridine1911/1915/1917 synthase
MERLDPSRIVFADNHLLVVDKPPGVPSQADDSAAPDLLSLAREYVKEKYGKPGNVYLGLVHRLDRPVGGLVVLARTSKAAARLSAAMREGYFVKEYLAIVTGSAPEAATLVDWLLKDRETNTVRRVPPGTPGAREARLAYRCLARSGPLSLLAVRLETGRSHQIRVQLCGAGLPIVGDHRYGGATGKGDPALFAAALEFPHPVGGREMAFRLHPPGNGPWAAFRERFAAGAWETVTLSGA